MLRALTIAAVVMYAAPAAAQIDSNLIAIELNESKVNIEECESVTWNYKADVVVNPGVTDANSDYALEFGTNCVEGDPQGFTYTECTPDAVDCCQLLKSGQMEQGHSTAVTQTISHDLTVSDVADCDSGTSKSYSFVVKVESFKTDGTDTQEWSGKTVNVEVDLERPSAPPDSPGVAAGETTADITWDNEANTEKHVACVFRGDYDANQPISEQDLTNKQCSGQSDDGSHQLTDLQIGLSYTAVLARYDEAGNESLPSSPTTFTTQEVTDFYEMYRQTYGGGDPGGYCATSPGAPTRGGLAGGLLLCFVGLGLGLRRRRRALSALLAAGLLSVAAPAFAESPKFMTFEFRIGSWLPNIDSEFSGLDSLGIKGPYETTFGDEAPTVLDLEFAAHVYQGIGTAAVGVGLGRGSISKPGLNSDGTKASEETTLSIFPLSLFASYAFDWPADRWSFPIVPYGKLGLDWVLYDISDGQGDTSTTDNPEGTGEGGTVGWHWALGGRLLLDALSPEMARTFDLDMGVNNSYLFFEYLDATVDDFGDDNALRLGAEVFFWGLAFDF